MHIEIFQARDSEWHWHKTNKGRITCDSEAFPTKQHAVRAAKADVTQTIKPFTARVNELVFTLTQDKTQNFMFILRWS